MKLLQVIFWMPLLSFGCNKQSVQESDIYGSWYFVQYAEDMPYTTDELPKIVPNEESLYLHDFNYTFQNNKKYQYTEMFLAKGFTP